MINRLSHGGDLQSASIRYGITEDNWIDLSTGINPVSYPLSKVPSIPDKFFQRLPYWQTDFIQHAKAYYQSDNLLPVAGTQTAIQALPKIINQLSGNNAPVLLPQIGYQEHAQHWQQQGNTLVFYPSLSLSSMCEVIDKQINQQLDQKRDHQLSVNSPKHLVIIQPNNPSTIVTPLKKLQQWAQQLNGGYLIIDEAFIDTRPNDSILTERNLPKNIIVLRSFGKFFGLAGLRLGFVFSGQKILSALKSALGQWQINGVAQFIASHAFIDHQWQQQARQSIAMHSQANYELFLPLFEYFSAEKILRQDLFLSGVFSTKTTLLIYETLANTGILTRLIYINEQLSLLRVGLVNANNQQAIKHVQHAIKNIIN